MQYPEKKPKASAIEVIRRITKQSDPQQVADAVDAALFAQWQNAATYQHVNKRSFELTFEQFMTLVTPSRRKRMEAAMTKGTFERMMKGKFGYVLGWKSRSAFKTGVMSIETAAYMNREDSERSTQFGPGDQHTDDSKDLIRKARTGKKATVKTRAKMSASKTGKPRDEETKQAISNALKGSQKSEEHKAKISAAVKASLAEKKAAKEREQQCPDNTPTKPSEKSEMPVVVNVIPMTPNDVSEKRNEAKSYPTNIAQQLRRVSVIVGRKSTETAFEADLSVQA
ncbi:hypothetical protein ASF91_13240 [Rhizobium sp. Leaf155]|nr:hypothetical protein ASF91_13240 [Rhizobium sp. Leaf155]